MLVPMAAGGVLLLRGRHAYPRDVATALASDERIAASGGAGKPCQAGDRRPAGEHGRTGEAAPVP